MGKNETEFSTELTADGGSVYGTRRTAHGVGYQGPHSRAVHGMAEWRLERKQMAQLSARHAVLHHSKWSSSYKPAHTVAGMRQGEHMDRSKLIKMQAQLLHAVSDHAEREENGREQAHSWKLTAGRAEQRKRLDNKGFQFARVGGRPWTVYGQGSSSYQPYQPCPDEPKLGEPIGGWKEHTDWVPDRNAPATAFYKHLPPGHSQPWFKEEPKRKKKKPKKSVYGNDEDEGGWKPGRSLAPRRAKDYVSNRALGAEINRDLQRTEARLRLTRAGTMYADTLEEHNLPYQPQRSIKRPSTAPPRTTARKSTETAQPAQSSLALALQKRLQREDLIAQHARSEPQPEPEPESNLEPEHDPEPEAQVGQDLELPRRPSTAGLHRPETVTFAASSRAGSPSAAEVADNLAQLDEQEAAALAAADTAIAHEVLGVNSTAADPGNQKHYGYGDERTIWVGNLEAHHSDEQIIQAAFEVIGGHEDHDDVVEEVVIREKPAPKKNWCLVTFFDVEHAQLALLGRERLLKEKEIELPELSKEWKIKPMESKMLHSNAARLVHKVAENDTYRHDIKVHEVVQKHTRQPKVVMGPRYERVMSAPRREELHLLDENEKRQLAAAERIGLDPNSNAGHLVRTIAAFGEVEDQKNQEMKRTLMEHTELQKTLYRRAVKTHWDSTRGNTRPPSSPPSERLDEPTLSNAVSPTAKGHSQRSLVGAR